MFYALWTFAPILVSIISFSTYVMLGNQLTIGVAFTVNFYTNTSSFYVSSVQTFSQTGHSIVQYDQVSNARLSMLEEVIDKSILELHLTSFQLGLCILSRFVLSHILCFGSQKIIVRFLLADPCYAQANFCLSR